MAIFDALQALYESFQLSQLGGGKDQLWEVKQEGSGNYVIVTTFDHPVDFNTQLETLLLVAYEMKVCKIYFDGLAPYLQKYRKGTPFKILKVAYHVDMDLKVGDTSGDYISLTVEGEPIKRLDVWRGYYKTLFGVDVSIFFVKKLETNSKDDGVYTF